MFCSLICWLPSAVVCSGFDLGWTYFQVPFSIYFFKPFSLKWLKGCDANMWLNGHDHFCKALAQHFSWIGKIFHQTSTFGATSERRGSSSHVGKSQLWEEWMQEFSTPDFLAFTRRSRCSLPFLESLCQGQQCQHNQDMNQALLLSYARRSVMSFVWTIKH